MCHLSRSTEMTHSPAHQIQSQFNFVKDVEKYQSQITSWSIMSEKRMGMHLQVQVVVVIRSVCVLAGRYFSFPFKNQLS